VKYIIAPYESDTQITFLLANSYADFAISEDSDLLAYGCKKVCWVFLSAVSTYVSLGYYSAILFKLY